MAETHARQELEGEIDQDLEQVQEQEQEQELEVAQEDEVEALRREVEALRNKLEVETAGRTKAERALRERFLQETDGLGRFKTMGRMRSMFKTRFGTPRQGSLCTKSRGFIELDDRVVAPKSLTGLRGFSHVWIVFVFHENTNMHKMTRGNPQKSAEEQARRPNQFPSFVKPPQAGGLRVGLYATRTPHRPNPIGLSLARLHSVDEKRGIVHLRGIDLVDGTPVLDIKPYVPHVDTPVDEDGAAVCPSWVVNPKFDLVDVEFEPAVLESLRVLCESGKSEWFKPSEFEEMLTSLKQIIALDPRGVIHGRGNFSSKSFKSSKSKSNQNVAAKGEPGTVSSPKLKEHLFRSNFVVDLDTFRLEFRPHETERAILVFAFHDSDDLAQVELRKKQDVEAPLPPAQASESQEATEKTDTAEA
ncbi:tRNA adenine37-N6-methyltransferase [Hondaea fermentalgiana]|uniref:tRNA adenine37-N6-methyltransferase n=1 Tax=Hondaea fermentalgiana TaxID=2315210 RepID=A0A2R5G4H4_9STRA|nr:tRNA adenine37-N6-methyltransferase [Hondaea fermentalgiana]|eukprot:GBG25926.1 tRNA adenine37-N6-methyltransferase [Hondaea fermentalgiana]